MIFGIVLMLRRQALPSPRDPSAPVIVNVIQDPYLPTTDLPVS